MILSPSNTRAVVVGIEQYAAGPDWRLSGPALDACRFAHWLVSRGVPVANIDLLLAPLPENAAEVRRRAASFRTVGADQASVREVLTTGLFGTSSELLIVYWGGHGVVDDGDFRRLIYADATERDKRNLNLGSLLAALRSSAYARHRRQWVLVDACTTLVQGQGWAMSLPDERFAEGRIEPEREQYVLFAASPGQIAVNDTAHRTGLFSDAVRRAIEEIPRGMWPPDPVLVRDRVNERFQRLRAQGRTRQVPSHLWFRSQQADDRLVFVADPVDRRATSAAAGCLLLGYDEAARLRTILDGAMAPDDLAAIYRDATRNVLGMPPCPDDLWLAVEALRGAINPAPLFEFLVRVASGPDLVTRKRLWEWMRATAPQWSVDLGVLTELENRLRRTTLLLNVEPALLGTGFDVTAWSYSDGDGWQTAAGDEPWSWQEIGAHLGRALREIVAVGGYTPVIEFRMPFAMLDTAVEKLEVDLSAGDYAVGALCPVVVRPPDHQAGPVSVSVTKRKWAEFAAGPAEPRTVGFLDTTAAEPEVLRPLLCLGLGQGRKSTPDSLAAALAALAEAGVPVVLWHRALDIRGSDPAPLRRILRGRRLDDLPDVVHQQRLAARHPDAPVDHPGRDVVLLWADPDRAAPRQCWRPPA
ncbi:hypothetical protein AB5J62_17965 [Amycolatopsis sp. cg5]|uniref:VMAP-C domain-containing protein n=1 Tax=Amycolatopsis sp. cg5 TaxID=3238802 RepID=UPI003523EE2C